MQIRIYNIEELKVDKELKNNVFETWLYAYRANMTKDEYWKETQDESLEDIKKYYEKNKKYFLETELKNTSFFVVCIEGEKIQGQLELQLEEKNIIICGLGVHHENRNKGIATILLKTAIDFVFNYFPSHNLISYIKTNNIASLNLHKKLGFEYDGTINDFDSYEFKYIKKDTHDYNTFKVHTK